MYLEHRFKIREKLTLDKAQPFPGVRETLAQLSQDYQLVIISNTTEQLIQRLLEKFELADFFPIILGRMGLRGEWQHLESKAYHFIKLSRMTGVPIERMVYVGDNQWDFQSANQLNMPFIEARMMSQHYGQGSFIAYPEGTLCLPLFHYDPDIFHALLEKLTLPDLTGRLLES